MIFFIHVLRPCRRMYIFIPKAKHDMEPVFFFVLRLVTVFNFALLRELQTTNFIFFGFIISEHRVKVYFLVA